MSYKTAQYLTIEDSDRVIFDEIVSGALLKGWKLHGHLIYHNQNGVEKYIQVVVKNVT